MNSVKAIKTTNFRIDVKSTDGQGNAIVTVRGLTDNAKKYMRVKNLSRASEIAIVLANFAAFVTELEDKTGFLASF